MRWTKTHTAAATMAVLVITAVAVVSYRQTWLGWPTVTGAKTTGNEPAQAPVDQVVLSPKAKENLQPGAERLYTSTYERKVQLPGEIVDRPGFSDRGVVAPVTGTVARIHAIPGDTVRPGLPLFTLRLTSEALLGTQSELLKATREIEMTQEKKDRLTSVGVEGAVAGSRIIELDNQLRRLEATVRASRQELQNRGLTPPQIVAAADGRFVSEIAVVAPARPVELAAAADKATEPRRAVTAPDPSATFEVQELKVELGQQVQAGQTLCLLANHRWLYIEGHGFRQDIPLVARAAKEGWKVQVEFLEESSDTWPPRETTFQIEHLANNLDPATRTFAFYLPLQNQSKDYEKDGRKLRMWRFRPGQRVRLNVPVKEFEEQQDSDGKTVLQEKRVYVLPSEAVARDGAEAYVFEEKGEAYKRHSVRVLYEDRQNVVLGKDSLKLGSKIARRGALRLNRVLKSQGSTIPPGYHVHADGFVHMNLPGDEGP
jgi:cobalt-zinc-cadmium efflux system membrane fusion protein